MPRVSLAIAQPRDTVMTFSTTTAKDQSQFTIPVLLLTPPTPRPKDSVLAPTAASVALPTPTSATMSVPLVSTTRL